MLVSAVVELRLELGAEKNSKSGHDDIKLKRELLHISKSSFFNV